MYIGSPFSSFENFLDNQSDEQGIISNLRPELEKLFFSEKSSKTGQESFLLTFNNVDL
jgi:hypothetical protein